MDVNNDKNIFPSLNPLKAMNDAFTKNYSLFAKKAEPSAGKKKSGSAKKTGFARATGRDSVESLRRMLMRLDAKLKEVSESDVDNKLKEVFLMDIRREMNNLEGLIREVKMKEMKQAVQESKEKEQERKRRTEGKSLLIKKGYLYSIKDGGFDPSDYVVNISPATTSGLPGGISGGATADIGGGLSIDSLSSASSEVDLTL